MSIKTFRRIGEFYRDMWRMRSHLLAPLSALVSQKVKFEWRNAFDQFKKIDYLRNFINISKLQ
jgi:hypothetical protein